MLLNSSHQRPAPASDRPVARQRLLERCRGADSLPVTDEVLDDIMDDYMFHSHVNECRVVHEATSYVEIFNYTVRLGEPQSLAAQRDQSDEEG